MSKTLLDVAVSQMEAAPQDDAARLRVFELIASSELFLLLTAEPVGEQIEPCLFETSEGRFILAFDREERLTAFAEGTAPYAAVSGRAIAKLLKGKDIGLGLNLGLAPSSQLFPPQALEWLDTTVSARPEQRDAVPDQFSPPGELPETLLTALDARLAQAKGLASLAYLAFATYRDGRRGHLLAILDARAGAEHALASTVQEALTFSGLEAGEIDVTFLRSADPVAARLAKVGLRFDLPEHEEAKPIGAPGINPDSPPRLK